MFAMKYKPRASIIFGKLVDVSEKIIYNELDICINQVCEVHYDKKYDRFRQI